MRWSREGTWGSGAMLTQCYTSSRLICSSVIILRGFPMLLWGFPHALLPMCYDRLKTSSMYPSLVVLVFCSIKGRLNMPVEGKLSLLFNRTTPWLLLAFPFYITQTKGAVETELYLIKARYPFAFDSSIYVTLATAGDVFAIQRVCVHSSDSSVQYGPVPMPLSIWLAKQMDGRWASQHPSYAA